MCLIWKLNGETKTFVLSDHDPNLKKYLNPKVSIKDLNRFIEKLDKEEKEMEDIIRKKYANAMENIDQFIKKKISSLSNSRSALDSHDELKLDI